MPATIGAPAPEFTLKDQDQKEVKLSDYRGKKPVVLVFYPLDWSPVCTKEHACMVNDKKQFDRLDAQVLGLSVDSVWSHKAYADKMGIHYPLLADFHPRGAVAAKYGVYLEDKGITGRAIFIIDRDGKLAWQKNYDIPVVPDINRSFASPGRSEVNAEGCHPERRLVLAPSARTSRSRRIPVTEIGQEFQPFAVFYSESQCLKSHRNALKLPP